MLVTCKHCGQTTEVKGLGRKRLNIPLKNICDTLQNLGNVEAAAQKLGCSPGYIFKVLKSNGLKLSVVKQGKNSI